MCLLIYLLDVFICLSLIESQILPENNDRVFCGVEDRPDQFKPPLPTPVLRQSMRSATLELGVFYEPYLREKFNNNDTELTNYLKIILSGAQAVFNYPSMRSRVQLVVNRFEMVPSNLVARSNDAYIYIDNFCRWQWNTFGSNRNYDLGLFLVRANQYGFRTQPGGGTKPDRIIEGLAKGDSVCFPQAKNISCAMANVSYLDSMWNIAHEIMHTFGIQHLAVGCEPEGIMHRRGHGHFYWTNCTNTDFEAFLAENWKSDCLFNSVGTPLREWNLNVFPFHNLTMDEQCASNFGLKYSGHYYYSDLCTRLICAYDLLATIQTASPLEGTKCGKKETGWGTCIRGQCIILPYG